jgi:hypothetical protein
MPTREARYADAVDEGIKMYIFGLTQYLNRIFDEQHFFMKY